MVKVGEYDGIIHVKFG